LKIKINKYLKKLIKKNPKIISGRKNIDSYNYRINKTIKLIKEYFEKN
tara:strand:- start:336 stop:479 length:144 start_codon:yes stop_codon:yes gene_type:complete